jgi:glycerol-3-phosphate dehydrogenase (NAD(P)+)
MAQRPQVTGPDRAPIAVLGAGSWGTALALHLARRGAPTTLWAHNADHVRDMQLRRCNVRYLSESPFPDTLIIEADISKAINACRDLLIAVPSHAFRSTLELLRDHVGSASRISWATKGFELETGELPHEVATSVLRDALPLAVLSGPTFAREVAAGLPTALTIASADASFSLDLAQRFSDEKFRAYTSPDIVGVEVGGAVKNILAIAAGLSDGLGFGANTRVALITRGLNEMTRLGIALGARRETFMGLAGLGDLVLTCTDNLSRNRRFGLELASGAGIDEALRNIGQVVEGVHAAKAVHQVAHRLQVDMPISEQLYRVLYAGVKPSHAVKTLMSRDLRAENE